MKNFIIQTKYWIFELIKSIWILFYLVTRFFFESERGIFPQTEFVFDLELPKTFKPKNNDGEVDDFALVPASDVSNQRNIRYNSYFNNLERFHKIRISSIQSRIIRINITTATWSRMSIWHEDNKLSCNYWFLDP